ncbi:peptidase/hydrolase [Amycolatopsis mediterranei S699]|uniref:Peptidase/hydrolase n=2 Tax=Amycolatopsis mediterranei TaxID=33910 RepID=A0A0H3DEM4_AMYMU|nr:alpha/beta hydrolase [Amycolatopsis mediterranei]ADJ49365.1 peptidase/hydrolase [Amycolatopsis mediterranei U32]AEK46335.1 peptidase/hydrolase [Amycolatopsis mediterranei S699]AFO81073.1 peptidase/hydrolase [Amycolatopsis mediterranei S699]AGT88201.1 peptidase/hydrolase [Amycolatopsis mediterranei RB]KDO09486.1 peptidase [Amycolatopsis mediterranei]
MAGVRKRLVTAAAVTAVLGSLLAATPASAAESVDWQPCADAPGVDCAAVTVPVDWAHPDHGTTSVALARRKATDPQARIGSVLMDPGGPGGSGTEQVKTGWSLSPEITRRFDTVGFDPRGVGASTPISCGLEELIADHPRMPRNQAEFEQLAEYNRKLGESCNRLSGPLGQFGDTKSVARDMDAIRVALGEPKLTYYGVSYGTLMGQQYAELFPDKIRALVLDSNMDHSQSTAAEFLISETRSVQAEFGEFVAWCNRTPSCALHGRDVSKLTRDLQDKAARGELKDPQSEEVIEPLDLASIFQGNFYTPSWGRLANVLKSLADGTAPAASARLRGEIPINYVFQSVFCDDWRMPVHNFAELETYRRVAAAFAPDVKVNSLGWRAVTGCIGWPNHTSNPQHPLQVHGAPPLLVLSSRYDPATPYAWSQAVARQTGNTLLTYDGWGHGAYFKNSACVTKATDDYLITGKLPAPGTHCAAVEPPVTALAAQPPSTIGF